MHNIGLHQNRFGKSIWGDYFNLLEELFAEYWEEVNTSGGELNGKGVLDYILAKDPNHPCGEATERDRVVAATIIQWLGTPVGQDFIRKVHKQHEYEKAKGLKQTKQVLQRDW